MTKLDLNWSQRQFLYEKLKDVLDQKFDDLGGKSMTTTYGPTTQVLIREAIFTYCFYMQIETKIKTEKIGEDTTKEIYVFKLPIKTPIFGDDFDIVREVDKDVMEDKR